MKNSIHRNMQANRCFYALEHLFRSKLLNVTTKYRMYRALVRSGNICQQNLDFNYESGRQIEKLRRESERTPCLRKFLVKKILSASSNQQDWVGLVMWSGWGTIEQPKKNLVNNVDRTRSRGRSKKRWKDCVENDMKEFGVRHWKVAAEDRQKCGVSQNMSGFIMAIK